MKLTCYPVTTNVNPNVYEFLSQGPKGTIKKVVVFQEIDPGIFNLAFGDWDEESQKSNDQVRTNNKDRDIILATVASIVIDFMNLHPGVTLFAKGNTPSRTRLYQIGINKTFNEIASNYAVEGFNERVWEPFEKGKNYKAFTLKAK